MEITESILAKAKLTSHEMMVARVMYHLETAGGDNSNTRKFYNKLSDRKKIALELSVSSKIDAFLKNRAGK